MSEHSNKHGWIVALAGTGVNLALGILYAWSTIKGGIPDTWGWTNANKALPYSVACFVFALTMIPAGKLQDVIGPRWVATVGGILVSAGCIITSLSGSSLAGFVVGFGVLGGMGIGFGYASATPPAIKWFPSKKTGLITGIVVAGFGLASVYIAPLAKWMLGSMGISNTMMIFGIGFLIVVVGLSQLMTDPPKGYIPPGTPKLAKGAVAPKHADISWKQMLSGSQFYVLWLIYFTGAAAGLTFISFAQDLGKAAFGELAFLAVVILAVGNATGRITAGVISDKIGRQWTLFGFLLLQAIVVLILYLLKGGSSWPLMVIILLLIGGNYGSNLSLFPSATKDYFGLKNIGVNYGFIFLAWGFAGLIMPWVNGKIKDATGSNNLTFFIIICMLLAGCILTFVSRAIAAKEHTK
jgi:MFS transporter, OFA family, oxalate/formate antiporter